MRKWNKALVKWKRLKYVSVGKNHVDIINEEIKGSSIEEEYIEIRKCRIIILVDIIKVKISALEWDDLVLQEKLKSLM